MSVSQQPVRPTEIDKPRTTSHARPAQNGRWSAYLHLLVARLKELQREPEVVFWVFSSRCCSRLDSASPSATSPQTLPRSQSFPAPAPKMHWS